MQLAFFEGERIMNNIKQALSLNINDIFDTPGNKKHTTGGKWAGYDVVITAANQKGALTGVRFIFRESAREVFKPGVYVQVSNLEKMPRRIYFRYAAERPNYKYNRIINTPPNGTTSYVRFHPNDAELAIYTANWINRGFCIKFDGYNHLYYIEGEE